MTGIPHDYHDFKKEASYSHGFISLQKTTWKAFDLKSPQSVRNLGCLTDSGQIVTEHIKCRSRALEHGFIPAMFQPTWTGDLALVDG